MAISGSRSRAAIIIVFIATRMMAITTAKPIRFTANWMLPIIEMKPIWNASSVSVRVSGVELANSSSIFWLTFGA